MLSPEPPLPSPSPTKNPIPRHPHRTPQQNRHRRRHLKPRPAHKRRPRNRHQPGIRAQRTAPLHLRRQIANLPELIHGREHQPDGRGIDAPQYRQEPGSVPQDAPQTHEADDDEQTRGVHCDEGDGGAEVGRDGRAGDGEAAEVDCEVEVWTGEGLDDGEAEEEVPRRDPAGGDDVFAQEGDDDGAAAEDDGAGEVEGGEEGEGLRCAVEDGVEGYGEDEGDEEEGDDARAQRPGHGGDVACCGGWGFLAREVFALGVCWGMACWGLRDGSWVAKSKL